MYKELITEARELADADYKRGNVGPQLMRKVHELADALEKTEAELTMLKNEPPDFKFYYCESEDSYLLGHRVDNFYYAHWHDGLGFVWDMSRFLPWGRHVVAPDTAWKEHTYPSEPKEIGTTEWFAGFLKQKEEAIQAELAALREAGRWIPVSERLPKLHTRVLIYFKRQTLGRCIDFGHYGYLGDNLAGWKDSQGRAREVTHWMPLPAAPAAPVVHGRWIDDENVDGLYYCSECLALDHRDPRHRYCPSCGARMDGQ